MGRLASRLLQPEGLIALLWECDCFSVANICPEGSLGPWVNVCCASFAVASVLPPLTFALHPRAPMWLRDIPAIIPILATVYLVTVYLLLLLAQRVTATASAHTEKDAFPLIKAFSPEQTVPFSQDYAATDESVGASSQD